MPDMHKRADTLRDLIEGGDLAKLNEDCLRDQDVDLDGEIPHVPKRYAQSEWDGSSNWINFADTIEEAQAMAGDLGGGDYPWAPGVMVDLDTGVPYQPVVAVTYEPQRWLVHVSKDDSNLVLKARFTSEEQAREYIASHKADDEDAWTVLDDEPIDTLKEDGDAA